MTTNFEFAERVQIHFTYASRLRNGERRPSVAVLLRICQAYNLPVLEAVMVYERGPAAFGEYLRERVFEADLLEAS